MTSLSIPLPDPMREWVEQQAAKAGLASAGEFIRELIRDAQLHERIEVLALEGVESGPAFEMTQQHWQELQPKPNLNQH